MKKMVIAGSVSLQEKIQHWKSFWENKGYVVINYPVPISADNFINEYPKVHKEFFCGIENSDSVFIMNEDKNGIIGYIGAESFAEMAFAVAQKLIYGKDIEIILFQMPEKSVQAYEEVVLWLELGWIRLYK